MGSRFDIGIHGGHRVWEVILPRREVEKERENFGTFPKVCQAETSKAMVLGYVLQGSGGLLHGNGGVLEVLTEGGAESEDAPGWEDWQLHTAFD